MKTAIAYFGGWLLFLTAPLLVDFSRTAACAQAGLGLLCVTCSMLWVAWCAVRKS